VVYNGALTRGVDALEVRPRAGPPRSRGPDARPTARSIRRS